MKLFAFFALSLLFANVSSFGGSEDRFIKKYAMMKIYESCFGEDVVKQIRREMKIACAKCASIEAPPATTPSPPPPPTERPQEDGPGSNSVYQSAPSTFDVEKLHQAIMAFRPENSRGGKVWSARWLEHNISYIKPSDQKIQGGSGMVGQVAGAQYLIRQAILGFRPNPVAPPAFRPYPGINPSFYGAQMGYPGYQMAQMFYPGYQQPAYSPYGFSMLGQQFLGHRNSREMDIRSQVEAITSRMSGKVKNVTCVMQELGYLDDNLEPNYAKINERIGNLPVGEELRKDMQDGVTFCQQFSQCVPEVKNKSPLSRELIRPMFFFKCYKHKKLEACIMKDVREKYAGVMEDELDGDVELRRTGKASKLPETDGEQEIEDMSESMYEFLYASDSGFDIDGFL